VADKDHPLSDGTYIFTYRNHFNASHIELIHHVCKRIEAEGISAKVLNRSLRFKRRFEQLRLLHEAGSNRHNAYLLAERTLPRAWPVFLRSEASHWMTELLHDADELARARAVMTANGIWTGDKMMVELNDLKRPGGLYRKYGAYRVGNRIVPRHVYIGPHWQQRLSRNLLSFMMRRDDLIAEEFRYVRDNPHADQVMEIFHLLDVECGRIDYGLDGGRVQVWEINTNPMVVARVNVADDKRPPALNLFMEHFRDALAAVDIGRAGRGASDAVH
jgi:hypothetical protein